MYRLDSFFIEASKFGEEADGSNADGSEGPRGRRQKGGHREKRRVDQGSRVQGTQRSEDDLAGEPKKSSEAQQKSGPD